MMPEFLNRFITLIVVSVVVPVISAIACRVKGRVLPNLEESMRRTLVNRCSTLSVARSLSLLCALLIRSPMIPMTFIAMMGFRATKDKNSSLLNG